MQQIGSMKGWLWAAGLSAALGGCTQQHMAPPQGAAGMSQLPVQGRSRATGAFVNEDFKIGSYDVADVDRDATRKKSTGFGPWSKESSKASYSYSIKDASGTLAARCTEHAESKEVSMGGGWSFENDRAAFECRCGEGDAQAMVAVTKRKGAAQVGDRQYAVEALFDLESGRSSSTAVGYRFVAEGGSGAVEVIPGGGQAWLPKNAAEGEVRGLVCLYAGLMLYTPQSQSPFN